MLLQRVITAVVLLIIIIGALLISPLAFTAASRKT
jgi:phosphatidate cytidylyltransferase